jgi:4'-phosphopantetheinyl transferase EntD
VAAAVARRPSGGSLGIDAEQRAPLPDGVADLVCTAAEQAWCRRRAEAGDDVPWEAVVFSAKESIYKAWFPLTGAWLGYLDADLELDLDLDGAGGGAFRVVALRSDVDGPGPADHRGRFAITPRHVLTAVEVGPT